MSSHHKTNRPPNIEGNWLLTDRYSIIQGSPNSNPTLKDIQKLPDIDIILTQKKEFVVCFANERSSFHSN